MNSLDTGFWKNKTVLVTGGHGFIGSYVVERLKRTRGVSPANIRAVHSAECNLCEIENCERAVAGCNVVIHLAAITGGISFSRTYPARQYYESTLIDLNMVEAANRAKVEKFVAIGNLFAYSHDAKMPLDEEDLFNGLPAPAHRGVGWFKRNLAILADIYYRQYGFPMSVVYSANTFGPHDSTDPEHAHVIPSTIMKCLRDKELVVWGDGSPTRDFLYVEDVAEGLILACERLAAPEFVNLGSGHEVSIRELVEMIVRYSGFKGRVTFDTSKAGGDARRVTGVEKARRILGFEPEIGLEAGLEKTVKWYKETLR